MSAFKGAFEALRNAVGDVDADRILTAVEAEACAEQAAEIDRLRKELDATVKAKQENDERFQIAAAEQRDRAEKAEAKLPSRFSASPAQVDHYLRRILTEDTLLNYQWVIGNRAVEEAAKDIRMETARLKADGVLEFDKDWAASSAADHIDPLKGGGPYPSVLLCSQHDGFGPCPGAPRCTPRDDETGGA